MLRGTYVASGVPPRTTVLYKLPRLDSDDAMAAAREVTGPGPNGGYLYLPNTDCLVDVLQRQPVIIEMNWFSEFNEPKKHPFMKAQREFFFIGEGWSFGDLLGSWVLVANGYHKARNGKEWIRLQNCWGHDYPLVWMPRGAVQGLWSSGQMEASIAA